LAEAIRFFPQRENQRLDAFVKAFNRASRTVHLADYVNLLAELFELDIDPAVNDVPTAAILAQRLFPDKKLAADHWLCGVPVNLVPDRDRLLLHMAEKQTGSPAKTFNLKVVEELLKVFDDLFSEIYVNEEFGWLFRLKQPAKIITSSVSQVSGKNIQEFLPRGEQAKQWIAVLNEIQMILHAADSTLFGFNALWFEGVGSIPQISSTLKIGWSGNDKLFQTVAEFCEAEHHAKPDDFRFSMAGLQKLIVSDMSIIRALEEQSEEHLERSLQSADKQFAQMLSLLDQGRLAEINLYLLDGNRYSVGKAGKLDFLKPTKKLSLLLESGN